MGVLGSVKNRIKTMFIILKNRKKKKNAENQKQNKKEERNKKIILLTPFQMKIHSKINIIPIIDVPIKAGKKEYNNIKIDKRIVKLGNKEVKLETNTEKQKDSESLISKCSVLKEQQKLDNEKREDNKLKQFIVKMPTQKKSTKNNENILSSDIEDRILQHLSRFLKGTKLELKKLKNELQKEEKKLKTIKDKESLEKEEQKLEKIQEKIKQLNDILEKLVYDYDFKYYEELNDELLYRYIDNFKFKSNSLSVDNLVMKCKVEINKLESLTELNLKLNEIQKKKTSKKEIFTILERNYDNNVVDLLKLNSKENIIRRYLDKQSNYLENLTKEINDMTLDKNISSYLLFDKKYINNLVRLGIGISAFKTTFIGAFIGAFLINSATSNLLKGAFKREYQTNYFYKYQEFTNKITTNLDLIDETLYLISDSLNDISKLKSEMEKTYNEYLQNPKYQEMYKKIVSIEKSLISKEKETLKIKQQLEENKEKNKIKLKKLEDYNKLT